MATTLVKKDTPQTQEPRATLTYRGVKYTPKAKYYVEVVTQ